jgi:hypothetical protein
MTGFYATPCSEWKVFFWAITHSCFGIEDCLVTLQPPICFWRWRRYRQWVFRLPITVLIPPYLIQEYGKSIVGVDNWDEEDLGDDTLEYLDSAQHQPAIATVAVAEGKSQLEEGNRQ